MMKKCTPLWREEHFQVKCTKHTPCSDHFWKLRCQKSARRCGAKHVSKSKVQEMRGTEHFWTFRCRCMWQAQGTVHLVKSEHNVEFCSSLNHNHHYTHPTPLRSTPPHYTTTTSTTTTTTASTTTTTLHHTTLH